MTDHATRCYPSRVRTLCCVAALMVMSSGCAPAGVAIYPHPPGEPGTDPGPEITGISCDNPSASCEEAGRGSGEAVKPFALVTVRVTVDDLVDPPVRVGPRQVTFLHPPLGPIPFRGRDRDLTVEMLRDRTSSRIAGVAFFERNADALVGVWVVGMRRGGARRVRGRYAGTLDRIELPAGRDRVILIELLDFCYPTVRLTSRLHWSSSDGSGSPVTRQPALRISGCGSGSGQ